MQLKKFMFLFFSLAMTAVSAAEQDDAFLPMAIREQMETVTTPSGVVVQRWFDPEIVLGAYRAVIVDPVVLHPKRPKPTAEVSVKTMNDLAHVTTQYLRREIRETEKLATAAAPNTLRLRSAITAVDVDNKGLSPRELLPFALVFAATQYVSGTRAQEATIQFEWELLDAKGGRLLAAGVRKDTGAIVERIDGRVRVDSVHLKESVSRWAYDAREAFARINFH
jgi:hypothetical protein